MQRPAFTSAEETQMGTECATVILGLVGKKKIKAVSSPDKGADSSAYID